MKNIIIAVFFSILAAYATVKFVTPQSNTETQAESVYDRVMRTKTLRCGYTPYSIGFQKDLNTGEFKGIYVDIVQELAKSLGLKVEYVAEVGWGEQIEGLNTRKFDLICSPSSLNSGRARVADFSIPLYYSPVVIWKRLGDSRFDNNSNSINNKNVRIATMDGEQTSVFARNYFPQAQQISLPQNAAFSDLMLQVTTKKADVVFAEPTSVYEFMAHNPNSLTQVKTDKPLVVVPNILLMARNQYAFKQLIDNGLREMFNSGFIDRAIDKHELMPNSYIRESALR